jgi:3',5'-cyclic AMP phosphodiesterase CpdA
VRTVVHISDIHFGRVHEATVKQLLAAIHESQPDVVAVSGDLTQRARRQEFEKARAFLDQLPKPYIVVPGNHDIPSHNLFTRFAGALDKYKRYISEDLEPFFCDDEFAIAGLNTARSLTIKGGRINHHQIARIEETLGRVPPDHIKIVMSHHPFDLPASYETRHLTGRAQKAMARFAASGVDVFLAGHFHLSFCGRTAERYSFGSYSGIFVQAGTACSTRGRGEPNSFNIIRTDRSAIAVETMRMNQEGVFRRSSVDSFMRSEHGWIRVQANS